MPHVTTDDAVLYAELDGSGEPVTVVAHGLTNNRNELAALTPLLPGTKVRFDFRGHGRSSAPGSGYAFADMARDLDAVALAYGATRAIGTSLGAGAIASLLSRDPDRFERTVWIVPAALDLPFPFVERYEAMAAEIDGKSPQEALEATMSEPHRVAEYVQTPGKLELYRVMWDHDHPDGVARAVRGIVRDWPVPDRELLRAVTRPVLLICIEGDEIHPAELGAILHELMPNSELVTYPSQGALFAALPELVAHVGAFIAGNDDERAEVGTNAMSELEDFRRDKDDFFAHHPQSPLTDEQRERFAGLRYFPSNPDLVIAAELQTDGVDREEPVMMRTTAGGEQVYRRAGVVRFSVEGREAQVTLYESDAQHELFVPFRDATSGKESYGAGRYLEVDPPGRDGRVLVDFNLAYNPYCAYNPLWACPIPPGENRLSVPVRAGEQTFPDAWEPPTHVG